VKPKTNGHITAQDAAELLDCSLGTVYGLIESRKLKAYRLHDGGWWRLDRASVQKFLADRVRANGHRRQVGKR
jgi:excisionase family DNA binding protein